MMNRYIITEEQLQRQHEVMSKTGRKKYEKELRSNLYNPQADRENVLGEISVRAKRLRAGNFKSEVGENNILDWIIKVCEELRQIGAGE